MNTANQFRNRFRYTSVGGATIVDVFQSLTTVFVLSFSLYIIATQPQELLEKKNLLKEHTSREKKNIINDFPKMLPFLYNTICINCL